MRPQRSSHDASTPLLSHAFRYCHGPRLVRPRATLYRDRVELTGWSLRGRHQRIISLDEVQRVQWWTGAPSDESNFALVLADETLLLRLDAAGLWKCEIDQIAPSIVTEDAPLPMATVKRWASAA